MGTTASIQSSKHRKKGKNLKKQGQQPVMQPAASTPKLEPETPVSPPAETGTPNANPNEYTMRKDKSAAIVVYGCQEEYQTLDDEKPDIVLRQVGPNLKMHPMIRGEYCLVRDGETDEDHLSGAHTDENRILKKQRSKIGLPILGISQPSCKCLQSSLERLKSKNRDCLLISVRADPYLFSFSKGDWYPYALRKYTDISNPLYDPHRPSCNTEMFEVEARSEVLQIVKATRDSSFYFYDDITFFEDQPCLRLCTAPDYLLVPEEVYQGAALSHQKTRYLRMNFTPSRFPLEEEVDRFIMEIRHFCTELFPKSSAIKTNDNHITQSALPSFLITGHDIEDGTIQLAFVMVHLTLRAISNTLGQMDANIRGKDLFTTESLSKVSKNKSVDKPDPELKRNKSKAKEADTSFSVYNAQLQKGRYYFVRQLGRYLPFMVQIKEEVDQAINDCDERLNIREQILESVIAMQGVRATDEINKISLCKSLYQTAMDQMERYHLLICFNAYLHEQMQLRLTLSFSQWMKRQPRLYQLLEYLDVSEWYTTADMLKYGHRVLVTDSSKCVDELCTQRTTGMANFRQLVGWPIYGTNQPTIKAITSLHEHLVKACWNYTLKILQSSKDLETKVDGTENDEKDNPSEGTTSQKVTVLMPQVIWVCLRDEYTIEYSGETCTWRAKQNSDMPIVLSGITGLELEDLEEKFAISVSNLKPACALFDMDESGALKVRIGQSEHVHASSLRKFFKTAFDVNQISEGLQVISNSNKIPAAYSGNLNRQAEYHRIPMPRFSQPPPPIFDQILRLILNNSHGLLANTNTTLSLKQITSGMGRRRSSVRKSRNSVNSKEEWNLPQQEALINHVDVINIVFFCENGKERTSLAMSIAGLVYCHLFGFMFGYRVEEEERISLRNAKYTKGEFQVIERLIRMLPNGHQIKREVDCVLDKCFDSMSMMHFHVREEIYYTYVKSRDEKCPDKKYNLRKQSLEYLEKYFFLILFNAYLHDHQSSSWKVSFETWLQMISHRCNYMDLLDDFGFPEFESPDKLRRIRERWRPDYIPHPTSVGNYA